MRGDAAYWDSQAATFDDGADHGLRDPRVKDAWRRLLLSHLPPAPAAIADLGCGTRAAGVRSRFVLSDAEDPNLPATSFDVVLARTTP